MQPFSIQWTTTWNDVDANGHVRNTAYSEYATHARVSLFQAYGLPPTSFIKWRTGPVLLKEELHYRRELYMQEAIRITCVVKAASEDFKKYAFEQQIFNEKGKLAANISIEGVWINLDERKVTPPPEPIRTVCARFPRTEDFEWL